ncbi:methyltransferase [Streptomyces sp. NPDC057686]|uniref:methyltransferase n=1 Tax=Streptomyces sp. NPDC057686 TaxID=3346212 RepID=UPI00367DD8D8
MADSLSDLFSLTCGAWSFKTFATAVELGLFSHTPATSPEIEKALTLPPHGTDMLLAACAAMGLIKKDGDRWHNTKLTDTYLIPGKPHYFGDFTSFVNQHSYAPWHRISDALHTGKPVTWDPSQQENYFSEPDFQAQFSKAMHSGSAANAHAFAQHVTIEGTKLLDVGAATGNYSIELCHAQTSLTATLLDLPSVIPAAQQNIKRNRLTNRIDTIISDFRSNPLPIGHDTILLSHILHDWNDEVNHHLLESCKNALEPGGTIIINELFLNEDRTGPLPAALMGISMIAEFGNGRNFSPSEISTKLTHHGFKNPAFQPLPLGTSNGIITATLD